MCSLKAIGITKSYGETDAVRKVDFEIFDGQIASLIGSSGSGKSTLLKILAGIIAPTAGAVVIDEQTMPNPTEMLIPGYSNVSLLQQDFQLPPRHTVYENVRYPLRRFNVEYQKEKVNELLHVVGLGNHANQLCVTLSGGQQQRVAMARALAAEPNFLLLDEPFNQLDYSAKDDLKNALIQIVKTTGTAVLITSHDPVDSLSFADSVLVLRDGEIVAKGFPDDLYQNPKSLYVAKLFGLVNVLSAKDLAKKFGYNVDSGKYMVRPENLHLDSYGYSMEVSKIYLMGHFYIIEFVDGDFRLRAAVSNNRLPSIGQRLNIRINPSHIMLLEEHD